MNGRAGSSKKKVLDAEFENDKEVGGLLQEMTGACR